MPITVAVPRLGWTMEEATFIEWMKADGDTVRPGDAVFKIEGEKSVEEIESLDGGILQIPPSAPKPGDRVKVGTVIGYLLESGEKPVGPPVASSPAVPEVRRTAASPAVRRMARERGLDLGQLRGSGPAGRVLPSDISDSPAAAKESLAPPASARSAITPRARRLAKRLGIDWMSMTGTGAGGRIRERDIAAIGATPATVPREGEAVPHSRIRKATAARMVESHQQTAPVTLFSVVDATNLVNLRAQFKTVAAEAAVPAYNDFLVKLIAVALRKHPALASRWTDSGIVPATSIDIGLAVDTESGLFVPVIRDVPSLGLRQVAARSRELIEEARQGKLHTRHMSGGCFTLTNLGAYGVDGFTPLINPPECAILGIGRIERQPVMDGKRVVGRDRVTLSLTFDHRIIDGGPAARFLQSLAALIENPGPWLMT